jgi:hypothetical protein
MSEVYPLIIANETFEIHTNNSIFFGDKPGNFWAKGYHKIRYEI